MKNKFIIVDMKGDFMKDKEGKIIIYENEKKAKETCGIYEFADVWICKLIYNYKE